MYIFDIRPIELSGSVLLLLDSILLLIIDLEDKYLSCKSIHQEEVAFLNEFAILTS